MVESIETIASYECAKDERRRMSDTFIRGFEGDSKWSNTFERWLFSLELELGSWIALSIFSTLWSLPVSTMCR